MGMRFLIFTLILSSTSGCKTFSSSPSNLRDTTLIDREDLPPVNYAYWTDKDYVYRGYCSWSSAPSNRTSCTQNVVKIPMTKFLSYYQKLEIMRDDYPQTSQALSDEQKQEGVSELVAALKENAQLAWLPMQRRVPSEARDQIKLSDAAILMGSRINQAFLGMGQTNHSLPPFMVSLYELAGRGAIKIGLRNGLEKNQSVIVRDGKALRYGDNFFDLFEEIPADQGARPSTCQIFNIGSTKLPPMSILFVSGWDRQNPNHRDLIAFRLYKDPLLTQETGYMSCVGAFSELNEKPVPVFPLGEFLTVFKDQSDFVFQGYME
jgi:hypothetical protein